MSQIYGIENTGIDSQYDISENLENPYIDISWQGEHNRIRWNMAYAGQLTLVNPEIHHVCLGP